MAPADIHVHPLARGIAALPILADPGAFATLVWSVFAVGLAATFAPLLPAVQGPLDRLPRRLRSFLRSDWSPLA